MNEYPPLPPNPTRLPSNLVCRNVHPRVCGRFFAACARAGVDLSHRLLRELLPRQIAQPHRSCYVPPGGSLRGSLAGAARSLPSRRVPRAAHVKVPSVVERC